jgi:hypothetical protein
MLLTFNLGVESVVTSVQPWREAARRTISKVSFLAFNSCQLLLPSGPLAPSSHKARYNPS